ncbi:hypothetical protein [Clostridium lundense]|uniref:hypothetical protein n=1 Tax=Clostridium lundense TaxID=319475 RepID=UPI0004832124|nr:hypothetical protein [Clostridium lundense]
MKTIKVFLIWLFPILIIYSLNIILFNKYPMFIGCFCGSGTYIISLHKINSCEKLLNNIVEEEKKRLSTRDLINLILIFVLTFLFIILVYSLINKTDLGYPFWATSFIFMLMGHFKFPKRFYS